MKFEKDGNEIHIEIPPKEEGGDKVNMTLDIEKDAKKVSEYFVEFTKQAKTSINASLN